MCIESQNSSIEQLIIDVKNDIDVIVIAVYFPPKSPMEVYLQFTETLENLFERYPESCFLIRGDFNLPHTTWLNNVDSLQCKYFNATNNEIQISELLLNSMNYTNLMQINDILNSDNKTLDLIFVREPHCKIIKSNCPLVPCDSYHPAIECYISFSSKNDYLQPNVEEINYNFDKADYLAINNVLCSIDWLQYFHENNLNSSIEYFYEIIYYVIDKYVPKYKFIPNNFPPWYSVELKNLLHQKSIVHMKYKITLNVLDYLEFSNLRRKCKQRQKIDYDNHIVKIESNILYNIKSFWKYSNSKRGVQGLPNVMFLDD